MNASKQQPSLTSHTILYSGIKYWYKLGCFRIKRTKDFTTSNTTLLTSRFFGSMIRDMSQALLKIDQLADEGEPSKDLSPIAKLLLGPVL